MPKINITSYLKKRLIIISMIITYSFIYTYMVAILMAQSLDKIYYYGSSGLLIGALGCLTIFIIYNIDKLLEKIMVKSSKFAFMINFFIGFFISILMFAIIAWLLNVILRDVWTLNFSYFKEQLVIINYLLVLILSYYTISYFLKSSAILNKKLKSQNLEMSIALNKYLTRIPSISNKKTVLIPINNILFFKIEEGIVFAFTIENKKHSLSITTLNELETKLNPTVFFRINRSEIVHINKVSSYEPYFKDRLAIKFTDSKNTIYTSNKKSAQFRDWLINAIK